MSEATSNFSPSTESGKPLPSEDAKLIEEYLLFNNFVKTIILPHEPKGFKGLAEFHDFLIYTACLKRSATAAPRGSLKSTFLARYRALHRLVDPLSRPELSDVPHEIMIISEAKKFATDHIKWIQDQLKFNPSLIARYGNLVDEQGLTWNEQDIILRNGRRCIALSYGSQIRGKHPTDTIIDDLESRDNIGTPDTLEKLKDWFWRVVEFASIPETHMTVIGTIIAPDSLLQELVLKEGWVGRTWEALQENDDSTLKSIWESRWSVDYLLKRRVEVGTHRFNAEMQNRPLATADPVILPEWIRRHTEEQLSQAQVVRRYMTCDPAVTEERTGCFSAIVILDETRDGRLMERLAWKKRVNWPDLKKTLIDFYYHFKSDVPEIEFGVEEVAMQKFIRQAIQEMDPSIEVFPLRPDKDKRRRLIDVSRYFEMGVVSLKTESLIGEVLTFPQGSLDRTDALVYGIKLYERHHPIIFNQQYVELDPLLKMDEDSRTWYVDKQEFGMPGYHLPSVWKKKIAEARMISLMLEDGFE